MAKRTTNKGNAKLAIGYLRVSTEDQHLGPEAQRTAIQAWAAREGVTIAGWFEDHGVSGAAAIDNRPALLEAIDAIAEHKAGMLVVAKRDRLARDTVAAAMIERLAERNGARVVSAAGEGTDSDDPGSILMRRMLDAFAEYERQIIRARTRAALQVKKSRGELVGKAPYGFQLAADGVHLERHEGEQAVIASVRAARDNGVSFRAIVAELERAGIRSRNGKPLGLAQVAALAA